MSRESRQNEINFLLKELSPATGADHLDSDLESQEQESSVGESHLHPHIALFYENQTEQFDAVIPFIRDGLERGEYCHYIYDDNTKEDALV